MSRERELADKLGRHLKRKYGSVTPTTMRFHFDEYDANRDGKMTAAELAKLVDDVGVSNKVTRAIWASDVFTKFDTDHDGLISWDDYQRAINDATTGP